jgi:hypothetical protein
LKYLITTFLILFLGGCTSSASYNVSRFTEDGNYDLNLIDERDIADIKYFEGCKMLRDPIDNIGDENIKPSKLVLLKKALAEAGISESTLTVKRFNLKLMYPNQCGIGRGAAMASVSVPAAIIMENSTNGYVEDGVICELTILIGGKEMNGYSYVPAGDGIRTLFGASVSASELEEPIYLASKQCVLNALGSL